jgi:hypothetical protein
VGGVLLDGNPAPVLALQVKDCELAKTGFAALAKCSQADSEEFGWTVSDDYVVLSDTTEHAEAIVSAGERAPLADSPDFQRWIEEAGGAGIVNASWEARASASSPTWLVRISTPSRVGACCPTPRSPVRKRPVRAGRRRVSSSKP